MIDWGNLMNLMGLSNLRELIGQYTAAITRRRVTKHPGSKKSKEKTKAKNKVRNQMAKESRRKNRGK